MKYPNGEYYVEVKDVRHRIHPPRIKILRKRDPPISFRNKYQVQSETQIRRKQKVFDKKGKLGIKYYPKNKQPIIHQSKFKPHDCRCCKQNNCLEFDKGYYSRNCEYVINKQNHQID